MKKDAVGVLLLLSTVTRSGAVWPLEASAAPGGQRALPTARLAPVQSTAFVRPMARPVTQRMYRQEQSASRLRFVLPEESDRPRRLVEDDDPVLTREEGPAPQEERWTVSVSLSRRAAKFALSTIPGIIFMGAKAAVAAVSAGRIGGKAPEAARPDPTPPPAPRIERQAPQPSPHSDPFFKFEFSTPKLPKIRIRDGDVGDGMAPITMNSANVKRDLAILGGVAGAAVVQNEVRKRAAGPAGAHPVFNVVFQVALQDTTGVLYALRRLAQKADTTSSTGLASLSSNVCLELLAAMDGWTAAKTYVSKHRDFPAAEKEFNEVSVRERRKWAYEEDPRETDSVSAEQAVAAKREAARTATGSKRRLMVVTLMVACRKAGRVVPKSISSAEALEAALERFAAALLERDGRNVIAVDVSWTPNDTEDIDILTPHELRTKWPDLYDL